MGQHIEDPAMDKASRTKVSPGYVFAAVAIWALVLYSLSSLSRPEPPRMALGPLKVCDSAR